MSILAICPYCQRGKIRAPMSAVGQSATCPKCDNCFTIVPSKELPAKSAATSSEILSAPTPVPARTPPTRTPPPHVPPAPKAAFSISDPTPPPSILARVPDIERDSTPSPRPAPKESGIARVSALPKRTTDPAFAPAMIALTLAGFGLGLSQAPYGRFATVLFGLLATAIGGRALLAATKKMLWPALGTGAGALALLLALLLPSWLGLNGWLPPQLVEDDSRLVKVMPFTGGGSSQAVEWIDAGKQFWQRADVRVSLTSASLAPVELVGPNEKKLLTREKYLVLRLRVANAGVVRKVDFRSWATKPAPEQAAPTLRDSTGKTLAAKGFDPGWAPTGQPAAAGLFPGKAVEDILVFELPAKGIDYLRLELPAAAFGDTDSVKLQIPAGLIDAQGSMKSMMNKSGQRTGP